ncbi:hypothetical protein ACR784_03110 [Sphingobacterium multivorum]|uniref:hypothetical protein n=1 Tax=Sphingobacterium TaxID=28453 RepID=UPI000E01812B|nr:MULTISPECIES: hypothetical protein [Sphingobacterium]QQT46731.1 hypothetical protein I6J00_08770 [Sphingobacterium multivorum]SUJ89129.1 Uncharacterised protein [Sphingobacterium multivorum]
MNGRMNRQRKGKFAFMFVAITIGVFLLVALLQYLWNTLMVDIFNLKTITYLQALGLFVLSRILFGRGFGKPGGGRFRKGFPRQMEKGEDLSDEERERLRAEWKRRFGGRCGF